MRSHKAAISLTTRKRLFSHTIQSLLSHSPLKEEGSRPLCRRLSCFNSQWVVQVREQKFAWHSSESLGKEPHIQSKASGGASKSKPSKAVLWVRPLPELPLVRAQVCNTWTEQAFKQRTDSETQYSYFSGYRIWREIFLAFGVGFSGCCGFF